MSRRRGVVVSDDEATPAPSRTATSRSVSQKERPRASDPPAPDLPAVAKLSPEEVQKVKLLLRDLHPLKAILTSSMSIVSDTAVAVEELQVSAENTEVCFVLLFFTDC
jgi:hypothetical protein